MGKKAYPPNVIQQAREVLVGLNQITPAPTFGSMTAATFMADLEQATMVDTEIKSLQLRLIDKRNLRDVHYLTLWDKVKRMRSAVKGAYGDDSTQYELVGGTRMSDRKPYRRKTMR